MRLTLLLLALLLPGLLFACGGGDEYAETDSADTPDEPTTPEEPKAPPKIPLSPEAKEVAQAYHDVKAMRGSKEQPEEARKRAEEFEAGVVPDDGQLHLGFIWSFANEPEKSAAAFKIFVENCNPQTVNYETGITSLIQTYQDLGETDDAARYVEKYIEMFPLKTFNHGKLQNNLARAKMAVGDFEGAAKLCEQAVSNDYSTAAQAGVECLWALGKYDEARTKADEWIELFRGSSDEKRCVEMAALCRKLGKKAPAFQVDGWAENEKFDLHEDGAGEVTLLYFWNMSLRSSEKIERAMTKRFLDRYGDKGFRIVGLSKPLKFDLLKGVKNESFGTKEEIEQLANWKFNYKTKWPLGLCKGEANHDAYGFRALPSYILIGKKGIYRFYFVDGSKDALEVLGSLIEKLLDE